MHVRTLFEFLLISTSVCATAFADTYRSGWRDVHLLCQPFDGKPTVEAPRGYKKLRRSR